MRGKHLQMEGGAESRVDRLTSSIRGADMEKQLRGQRGCGCQAVGQGRVHGLAEQYVV